MEDQTFKYAQHLHSLFSVPPQNRNLNHLEEIMKFTKNNKFLRKICEEHNSDRILWECSRLMTLEIYEKNAVVFNFGEIGDRFYIILQGTVRVIIPTRSIKRSNSTKQDILQGLKRMHTGSQEDLSPCLANIPSEVDEKMNNLIKGLKRQQTQLDFDYLTNFGIIEESKEVRHLTSGDCFGELALINNKPRTATIESKALTYLAVLSKKDFTKVLSTHAFRSLDERVDFLKQLPGFNTATKLNLQKLAYTFTEKTYKKDQIVYNEQDQANILFFIKSGEFKLSQYDVISTPKYSSSDVFVKLSQMKRFNRKVNLREVIKGVNEVFGYEELVENKEKRERKCACVSNFGQVYEVRIEDIKRFPLFSEVQAFFEKKFRCDHLTACGKFSHEKEVEKLFSNKINRLEYSDKSQESVYDSRKQAKNVVAEKFVGQSWSVLPSPCVGLKSENHEKNKTKKKNKLSLEFINYALANDQESPRKIFHRRGLRKSTLESITARNDLKKFKNLLPPS